MTDPDDDDEVLENGPTELSSPACFLHEVDPAYSGLPPANTGQDEEE